MALLYWRNALQHWTERIAGAPNAPSDLPTSEQHPFPTALAWKEDGEDEWQLTEPAHPLPIRTIGPVRTHGGLFLTEWIQPPVDSGLMAANDALSDRFSVAVPTYGKLVAVTVIDVDDDTLASSVHVFTRPFTAAASNAAFTISAADSRNWLTSQVMGTPTDIGGAKVVNNVDLNLYYYAPLGQFFCQMSTTGTPTVAAGSAPYVQFAILPMEA